jgi:protein-disulfide isomerase
MPAAMAAMAANEQGKFWEYHDKLFGSPGQLQTDRLTGYAKELGLDVKRFSDAVVAAKFKSSIDADIKEANALGAGGTPAFFVNGRFLNGAKPFEEFAKVINAELQRLNLPIPTEAKVN